MTYERRHLTDHQLRVLKWIADGCTDGVWPDHAHKIVARGLELRNLASVRRRHSKWHATLQPDGRFYMDHGRYPDRTQAKGAGASESVSPGESPPIIGPRGGAATSSPSQRTALDETKPAVHRVQHASGEERLQTPGQIRRPHPAVRELVDHPKRIDLPEKARRRSQLISHGLTQESLRRGWKITPVVSQLREAFPAGRERWWPSNDLFRLDAGECSVGVQFRVKTTRVEHADTAEEARRRARGEFVWAPRFDYVPTETLRLFLYRDTRQVKSWEDTARIPLEDRLADVLAAVDDATRSVVRARQAQKLRFELEQARIAEETRERVRFERYDAWRRVLIELPQRVRAHSELQNVVERLAGTVDPGAEGASGKLPQFVEWSLVYLDASDPLAHLTLPEGEMPTMAYEEWLRWRVHFGSARRSHSPPWPAG